MLTNVDALDRYFEFSRKWVAHIEDSRGCALDAGPQRVVAGSQPTTAVEHRSMVYKQWSRDRYAALVVDIVRNPPRSPRGAAPGEVTSHPPQGSKPAAEVASPCTPSPEQPQSGQLLERWTIQCVTEHPSDYVTMPAVLERRLSVLTRTLYSVTRLMPLFNYGKRAKVNLSSYVYVETSPPHDVSYNSIPSSSREFYALPRISLAWGAISIVVEFMNNQALQQFLSADALRAPLQAAMASPMPTASSGPTPQSQMMHTQVQQQQQQAYQGGDTGSKVRGGAPQQASASSGYVPPKFLRPPEAPQPQMQVHSPHLAHWGPGDQQALAQGQGAFAAASSGGVGGGITSRTPHVPIDHALGGSGSGSGQPPFASISRSLDSKGGAASGMYMASNINASYFRTPPAPRPSNAAPYPAGQFIEPGSSFNSSSSGRSGLHAEYLEGGPGQLSSSHGYSGGALAYSHQSSGGTIPQYVGIGGHLGSSPTQMVVGPGSLGSDIVGSSPVTGPGATFQYARQRGGSFDQQPQPSASTATAIRFYNLPPSPFDAVSSEKTKDMTEDAVLNRGSFGADSSRFEGGTSGAGSAVSTMLMGARGAPSPLLGAGPSGAAEGGGDDGSLSVSSGDDDGSDEGEGRESRGRYTGEDDLPFELDGEAGRAPSSNRPSLGYPPAARRRSRGSVSTKLAALNRSTAAAPATQGAAYQLQQLFQDAPKLTSNYNYGQPIDKLAGLLASSCEISEGGL